MPPSYLRETPPRQLHQKYLVQGREKIMRSPKHHNSSEKRCPASLPTKNCLENGRGPGAAKGKGGVTKNASTRKSKKNGANRGQRERLFQLNLPRQKAEKLVNNRKADPTREECTPQWQGCNSIPVLKKNKIDCFFWWGLNLTGEQTPINDVRAISKKKK